MDAADAQLEQDPVLKHLIDDFGGPLEADYNPVPERPPDVYGALLRAITGQQLSVKAAQAIYGRLVDRFGGRAPTPRELLDDDPEAMRTAAGLSHAKVNSLRDLAQRVLDGELQLERLTELSDVDAMRELTAVKGIGEWTAHMFLMFTLDRPDVLPVGDQGIKNAFKRHYGLGPKPMPEEMEAIAEPWRPYRTRASLYLWRSLSNTPI